MNERVEPLAAGMGFNAMMVRRDPVEPEPVGTLIAQVFRITGYDQDCDGSLMARLEAVDFNGQPTGWEPTHLGLYPDTAVVLEDPAELLRGTPETAEPSPPESASSVAGRMADRPGEAGPLIAKLREHAKIADPPDDLIIEAADAIAEGSRRLSDYEQALREAEAELRVRALNTNEIGQIEPPYTATSLLSMADMIRAALSGSAENEAGGA
jgi:hypothetical protein